MPVHDAPEYEWGSFLQRRHPHRLDAEQYRIPGQSVLVTMCAADRTPLLLDARVREEIVAALDLAAGLNGCDIVAWCLMPEHIHVLLRVVPAGGDILQFIHSFKTWTGRVMREAGFGRVWERSFWDRHARTRADMTALVSYVMHNPVRRGMCRRPEDWPYSEFRLDVRVRSRRRGGT